MRRFSRIRAAHYMAFGVAALFQQQTQPAPGLSLWEQPALIGALIVALVLIVQALGKDGVSVIHELAVAVPRYLQTKEAERKMRADAFQAQVDQNKALFAQIERRDDMLRKVTDTLVEVQRLANDQRAQFQNEREAWQDERNKWHEELESMLDSKRVSDAALEQLVKENRELKAERDRLKEERDALIARLRQYETIDRMSAPLVETGKPQAKVPDTTDTSGETLS